MRGALLGLAGNPALTAEPFALLVAGGDEDVLHTLAGRERPTTDQVRALLDVGDPALTGCLVRRGLVPWSDVPEGHPGRALDAVLGGVAPLAVWWEAATDPDAEVRQEVAYEFEAPAEVLAADPDPGVARRIAGRPETAPGKLAELVERHGPAVFGPVARHPACPAALLRRMAAHPAVGRRFLRDIARHPAAPVETLLLCLTAAAPDVRQYAAAHPALPVPVLESLLGGPDGALAGAAAENPALPVTLMERIAAE
ncbi:hypothetical protein [Streptomyces sp. NPDC004266]|uniref:hypothetical protein n=1 Tax=Streptomyces sp. NPDC004266 TaxID=3364693 RepID=UPI0036A5BABB